MNKLTVEIAGDTDADLETALEEVLRLVREGYTSGANRNESGRFVFTITETDVE